MKLAAAHAIAELSAEAELVPDVLDPSVHARVADAVAEAAAAEGVASAKHAAATL
jgi:malate dehydrogenase (oxaloacetate-decarboxylating)